MPIPTPADPVPSTTAALTDALFAGRFDAVHAPWRALSDDASFRYPADAGPEERVAGSYRRLRLINQTLDSVEELVDDVEALAALHEWLCPTEGGLATFAGIHYNLFLGSLLDHDADDRRDLTPFLTMRHTGIFLCTEVGHGNDAARLETTATYDPSTGGFVLHTPTPAARKFMPNAGTAGGPKTGLVAARLIHRGKDQGVFLFLTPLTDDRGALPGVRIRRLPDKIGYAVDHCLTSFDHVRLPPHAFLAGEHGRLAADGAFTSSVDKHRLRFLRSIDRVTPGKLHMSAGAVGLTRTALTIAVRYAHTRRTTGLLGGQSVPLFDHGSHRTRLLDALADTYAVTLLHRAVLSQWVRGGAAGRADDDRLVAIAKAWITWRGRAVAVECRERCGAQGVLPLNGIAELPDFYTAGITAEGDNLVIWGKAAGELLARELPVPAATAPDGRRLDDPEFLQALLGDLEYIWHQRASARWIQASSTTPLDRWNAAVGPALEMTSAHAECQAARSLLSAATRSGHHEARTLLLAVHRLFVLGCLARHAGDLLAEGRITADHVRELPDAAEAARAELAPHALTLVDALAVSPKLLDRFPIARTDFLAAFDRVTRHARTESPDERGDIDVPAP
ncbi:acyl-CoA dehydrogenase family protein [Actinoallomurus sp. CA-142502]|uniref:acyl-CoA dehydrogenase family protein n=1 Tax=Actinoallomurus sp. CA-142502 TaxID=3239885 RepID=UPI003D8DF71C